MDFPKSVPNIGLVNGRFVDENVGTGMPGSLIPSAWGNAVTEEFLNVFVAAGIAPSEVKTNQLAEAISKIVKAASSWDKIEGKPTTLAGFGINDAYTKAQVDAALNGKAGKATTLSGYGITNAYTAPEIDTALGFKANVQSPTFTGTPKGDTAVAGTNNKQLATTEYVDHYT